MCVCFRAPVTPVSSSSSSPSSRSPCGYFQLVFTLIRVAKWQGNATRGVSCVTGTLPQIGRERKSILPDSVFRILRPDWTMTTTHTQRKVYTHANINTWTRTNIQPNIAHAHTPAVSRPDTDDLSALLRLPSCQGASERRGVRLLLNSSVSGRHTVPFKAQSEKQQFTGDSTLWTCIQNPCCNIWCYNACKHWQPLDSLPGHWAFPAS